ncbi:uncharacterized protein LOC134532759 isoform X1 [Bacillus rossius redtenbacheri]|uniref:uncharacterized protein LOC134532759 isoform X1 n=2 Tax=Bacillus rossius redtenbacheri TaxID=93214 RepID=UPI002FDE13E1
MTEQIVAVRIKGRMAHISKDADTVWRSVASSSYTYPEKFRDETLGPRRKQLEKYLTNKIMKEVVEQMRKNSEEKTSSEYNERFCDSGFQPMVEQFDKHSELHQKHPLYKDLALSYWLHSKAEIQGATSQSHSSMPFNRNANFSKPISEVLDEQVKGEKL